MGIGELFEFEKTGRIDDEPCHTASKAQYRSLKKGEKILETDEYLDDIGWVLTKCAGRLAPDPLYTCHRQYRRKLER